MKLQLLSDLHLERQPGFVPQAAPGADVLVLAGDIGSYQPGSRLTDGNWGLERFAPSRGAPWRHVLFVPGNHEYDGLDFDTANARLRAACGELGIVFLERAVHVIDGVRFVGTTLWTDFDALATGRGVTDADEVLHRRERAFRAANFWLQKNTMLRAGEPLLAPQLRALGLQCQAWLLAALEHPFDGPTVVVTHFAPSLASADPRYGLTPGTAGFCNALDGWLPAAQLWLHGHLHAPSDYTVAGPWQGREGTCRVVANPLGYADKKEQGGFRPELVLEV